MDTGLDSLKTAPKRVVQKAKEFLGNKSNDNNTVKPYKHLRNVKELIIPQEKRDEILNKLRKVLQKWKTIKYLSY